MNIDEINELCRDIAQETMTDDIDAMITELEEREEIEFLLSLGPRAFGPDLDEGADDCSGNFYWDLK